MHEERVTEFEEEGGWWLASGEVLVDGADEGGQPILPELLPI